MSSPLETSPVSRVLTSLGIPHRVFQHTGPIHSLEQAASERGQTPRQVVRSILFRLSEDEFLMILVAGPAQIPWGWLRKLLNQNRMTMANDEEVLQITGYPPGAVSPIGLKTLVRILADRRIFEQNEISLGSGQRGVAILLASEDLRKAVPEMELVDLFPS
jgi:Cys-tRNA(Pro)/Cys-tRNA(Cys) deacylase